MDSGITLNMRVTPSTKKESVLNYIGCSLTTAALFMGFGGVICSMLDIGFPGDMTAGFGGFLNRAAEVLSRNTGRIYLGFQTGTSGTMMFAIAAAALLAMLSAYFAYKARLLIPILWFLCVWAGVWLATLCFDVILQIIRYMTASNTVSGGGRIMSYVVVLLLVLFCAVTLMAAPLSFDFSGFKRPITHMVHNVRYEKIKSIMPEGELHNLGKLNTSGDDTAVNIDGRSGHAWPEIYQDGIGWIPVEVTPPYIGTMPQPDWSMVTSGSSGIRPDMPAQVIPEPAEEVKEVYSFDFKWLIIAAVLLLLAGLVVLIVKIILRWRALHRLYTSCETSSNAEAICNMFAYIMQILYLSGFERRNVSIFERDHDAPEGLMQIAPINRAAMFSRHIMSDEQRNDTMDFLKATVAEYANGLNSFKRFYMKWIRRVY